MKLEAVLQRVGATIADRRAQDKKLTVYFRVTEDRSDFWIQTITSFLLAAAQQDVAHQKFKADLSKYFFSHKGAIRYFWRLVLTNDYEEGLELLSRVALEVSLANKKELTSYPLVGRAEYVCDPARGLLKGGHDPKQAPLLRAAAIGGQ